MISTSNLRDVASPSHRHAIVFILRVCLPLLIVASAQMSADTYRVYLSNKGISPFIKGSELYTATQGLHNSRCVQRRLKVVSADSLFRIEDAPLYQPYLDDVQKLGAKLMLKLRWKNYVVVECDSSVMLKIKARPYVLGITSTGELFKTLSLDHIATPIIDPRQSTVNIPDTSCGAFRYGPSLTQNKMLHANELHALGEIGSNALLGILDNGFRWQVHDCYNSLRRVNEYDFCFQDSVTANDSSDVPSQDGHGTNTLSVIAGFLPDSLIGIAPGVQVILAKTEDMRFEHRIEEDNYAAAIEWMEAQGVDVTSSSVGYDHFDSLQVSYQFSDLDGHSTIVDMAVNRATALGMVCCTAAGNNGGDSRTIISPGDADSAITVGAYDDDSLHIAKFTSKGPNASGHLKPDVATLGNGVVVCNLTTRQTIGRATGTSFATPAMAGAVALLLSQFPEMKPYELRRLLYSNSSQSLTPDTIVGYGLPDFMQAAQQYGIVVSPLLTYAAPTYQYFIFSIRSAFALQRVTLFVRSDAANFEAVQLQATPVTHQFLCRVPKPSNSTKLEYYLEVQDEKRLRRLPTTGFASLEFGSSQIPCGLDPVDFPSTITDYSLPSVSLPNAVPYGTPSLQLADLNKHTIVRIFDALGRLTLSEDMTDNSRFVSLRSLQRGYYTLELTTADGADSQPLLIY